MTATDMPRPVHEGKNLKRLRELLQVKQASLAHELGGDWNQKKISQLEDKEVIDPSILDEVAKALKITPEAIKNFDEEKAITYISTFNDHSSNQGVLGSFNDSSSFILNPIEKWLEALEENKKFHEENKSLFERLLQSEKDKVELLERMLKESK